jgi:hypothetical protein
MFPWLPSYIKQQDQCRAKIPEAGHMVRPSSGNWRVLRQGQYFSVAGWGVLLSRTVAFRP